jgi:hypothetical protein
MVQTICETNSSSESKPSTDSIVITSYSPKTMSACKTSSKLVSFKQTSRSVPEATLKRTKAKIPVVSEINYNLIKP